jgi:hypothetical protein
VLYDVQRPHRERKLPQPTASLVYDGVYDLLSHIGLIRWVMVNDGYASLSDDHYVLTDAGRAALERLKREYPPIEVFSE